MDLAEDLDWAEENDVALAEHSSAVARIMAVLDPVVLYLDGDVGMAVDRAVTQRGRRWFRDAPTEEDAWSAFRLRLIEEVRLRARRMARAFEAGGWQLTRIDATSQIAAEVLAEALAALQRAEVY
jgi:hypothetical protein